MIIQHDKYNNPDRGRYRDPEIALQNIKLSGNAGNKYVLYPFGFIDIVDESTKENIKRLRFPKEYEKRYSSENENWLEICYNIIQTAANRHFWFLLTLKQKYEMCKFLMKYKRHKVYKMAKAGYTFQDLYNDLVKYQFTDDNDVFMGWIITDNYDKLKQYFYTKYIDYGKDYFILSSVEMWKDYIFDMVKDKLIIMDLSDIEANIHDGQYIINYQDPYGQRGR